MRYDDTPIKKQKDDLLDRKIFANHLAKALTCSDYPEGFCIGLNGPWGSGKTSIINMVEEIIDKMTFENDAKPIFIKFNPWNFSNKEQLINQYFVLLSDEFCENGNETLNNIGSVIKEYSHLLSGFGPHGEIISLGGKSLGIVLQKFSKFKNETNINKKKKKIIDALKSQKSKIIIVIDDIDRLPDDEIRLIFQLVNSVANFPNTLYLLSFDRDVVANALTKVQGYDGDKYLEKIIQVPINIPEVTDEKLWQILFERLNNIQQSHPDMYFDKDLWTKVLYKFIYKYIKNIRDIIRFTNVLSLKCDMLNNDINLVDLITITLLEVKEPNLYSWISSNKNLLVGEGQLSFSLIGKNEDEIRDIYYNHINTIDPNKTNEYISIVSHLFPYFSSKINGQTFHDSNILRRAMRVGNEDYFDKYFVLDIDENTFSRVMFDFALASMNEHEFSNYLEKLYINEHIGMFLKELDSAKNELSKQRIPVLIKGLVQNAKYFNSEYRNGLFTMSSIDMLVYKVRDLFEQIKDDYEKELLLLSLIDKCSIDNIEFISHFINVIELSHGRLAANGKENGGIKIIGLESVLKVEQAFSKQIKEVLSVNRDITLDTIRMTLHIYESFDPKEYDSYMFEMLKKDIHIISYANFSMHKWVGSGISWQITNDYKDYLVKDEIYLAFDRCLESKEIWSLDDENLHKAVAFRYVAEFDKSYREEVSDTDVIKKIEELKLKM